MPFCKHCGVGLTQGALFCGGCGAKISEVEVTSADESFADPADTLEDLDSLTLVQLENLAKLNNAIEDVASALIRIDKQLALLREAGDKLEEQSKTPQVQGNNDLSREILVRREMIAKQVSDLEKQRTRVENQLQKLEETARKVREVILKPANRKSHRWR
jgi:phage shock protein A